MICTEPAGGPEVAPRPTTSLLCTPDGYSGYGPYDLIPFLFNLVYLLLNYVFAL